MIRRAIGALAIASASAPLLLGAVVEAVRRPLLFLDGDFAIDELALNRSAHLTQLVGNYSRFGWSHPGPSWFYALDFVYAPFGRPSWAFVAGMLLLNGIASGLVVAVAWRARGAILAVVASALLLLYQGGIGEILFRDPWPPYAVILPMALLVVLAAAGAAGSNSSLAWTLVAASYLSQTHIGTTPTVAAMFAAAAAIRIVRALAARRDGGLRAQPAGRADRVLVVAGVALAALMWMPPLVDELTGRPGNLTLIWQFFTTPHPTHRYLAALSVLGRFLSVVQLGSLGTLNSQDLAAVSAANLVYAAAAAIAFTGLALAGWVAKDRFALSIGVILCAALPAITVSIHEVVGPVYAYLLLWVSTLPLVAGLGWASLLVRLAWPSRLRGRAADQVAQTAAAMVMVALSVVRFSAELNLPPPHASTPDTVQAWRLTSAALADQTPQPLLLELHEPDTWILAAGLALQLVKSGYTVHVEPDMLFEYGDQSRETGAERLALVVVDAADKDAYQSAFPDARLVGTTAQHSLYLARPPNDLAPPGWGSTHSFTGS